MVHNDNVLVSRIEHVSDVHQGKKGTTVFFESCQRNDLGLVSRMLQIADVDVVMPDVSKLFPARFGRACH